ncbi:MAG: phosphoenolpyruvate synthase [Candidatus Eisenbacteria bacterium]|nr:phosphoenolpyruvate synthase [Candidatus Eisenbacteria bacterium]
MTHERYVYWFDEEATTDVERVGGKNASLAKMILNLTEAGIRVPGGFATSARAYWNHLEDNELRADIENLLEAYRKREKKLADVGRAIRRKIRRAPLPEGVASEIAEAYEKLCQEAEAEDASVAVRSSATAEDLPEASFAGQQDTYLNVTGAEDVQDACRRCFASLFTNRAIAYRERHEFEHMQIALSVGVQLMVRSDKAGSGVMFTVDTESGFPDVVVINAAWGLGENVVQGSVTPDEYVVHKPLLDRDDRVPIIGRSLGTKEKKMVFSGNGEEATKNVDTPKKQRQTYVLADEEVLTLARWACAIEDHYGHAMDIEWAKDGENHELYIVQARPETVHSQRRQDPLRTYRLKEEGKRLVEGVAIGDQIASGTARIIDDPSEADDFEDGEILVTAMTDPDWVPIMKLAGGVVTDYGGRTAHAAIVSRELGIPAVIGSEDATTTLQDGQTVTLSCAEGERGTVYEGELEYERESVDLGELPEVETQIMLNLGSPAGAFRWWRLPARGIGLARMEFIIGNMIRTHPMALLHLDDLEDRDAQREIRDLVRGYEDPADYFVETLSRGIARIAASQYPHPVVVRMSDFKTNEYADLLGGAAFEPEEANPMLGFRGASRYYSDRYREGFALECRAIWRARSEIGLENIVVMIPFCRTVEEAARVLEVMADHGLERGRDGLEVYIMCEIPANVVLAREFSKQFDGFSIGSNDLTQLALGIDRDSSELAELFDERNPAVQELIRQVIRAAHDAGRRVGICGQAPSDHPEFAVFLVEEGIDSISINPDSTVRVLQEVARVEERLGRSRAGGDHARGSEAVTARGEPHAGHSVAGREGSGGGR